MTQVEARTVRGHSLAGLLGDGETVEILFGYFGCHPVGREDVVAYAYAGNPAPIIKVVKGLPGDSFGLEQSTGGWRILVNGSVVTNSRKEPYLLDANSHRMLALYERDYHGRIPRDAYLILGNLATGSLDSSRFGLVGKRDLLGKVRRK